jgi:CheY-like chemotaxis protein
MMPVMLVDDEPVSRRALKRLLSRISELDLHEAEDGEAAWTALADPIPRLIICDLSMPRMDGTTFIRKIREHPLFCDIPVIVISAANDRETLLGLKDLKILDYLLKPFDLAQTFARLERHLMPLLADHRARKEAAQAEAERAKKAAALEAPAEVASVPAAEEVKSGSETSA